MVDIPFLIDVDSRSAKTGAEDLTQFGKAAKSAATDVQGLGKAGADGQKGITTLTDRAQRAERGMGGMTQRLTQASAAMGTLNRVTKPIQPILMEMADRTGIVGVALNAVSGEADKAGSAMERLGKSVFSVKGLIAGLIGTAVVRDLQQVTMELQRVDMTFQAVTGSSAAAAQEMDYVSKTADALGQNVLSAAGSYAKLLAAAQSTNVPMEDTRNIFEGITAASTALGLSQYEVEGALMAVQQMMSKGSVQAEELRGQLGERLPGAFGIAAASLNMTTQELSKALEQGEVSANEFVAAFGPELQRRFGEFAKSAQTPQRAIQELENVMLSLKETVIDGGFQSALFGVLNGLTGLAQSGAVQAFAEIAGTGFAIIGGAVQRVFAAFEAIANFTPVVLMLNAINAALQFMEPVLQGIVVSVASLIVAFTGLMALKGVLLVLTGLRLAFIALGGAIYLARLEAVRLAASAMWSGIVAGITGLVSAIWNGTGIIAAFRVALMSLYGVPIIAGIALLVGAFLLFRKEAVDLQGALSDAQTAMDDLQGSAGQLESDYKSLTDAWRAYSEAVKAGGEAEQTAALIAVDAARSRVAATQDLIEVQRALTLDAQAALQAEIARADGDMYEATLNAAVPALDMRGYEAIDAAAKDYEALNKQVNEAIALKLKEGETISNVERRFLEQNAALLQAEAAYKSNETALVEMDKALEKTVETNEAAIKSLVNFGKTSQLFKPLEGAIKDLLEGFDQVVLMSKVGVKGFREYRDAVDAAFAATDANAQVAAMERILRVLDAAGMSSSDLAVRLRAALAQARAIAGTDVGAGIRGAIGAVNGLITGLSRAAGLARQAAGAATSIAGKAWNYLGALGSGAIAPPVLGPAPSVDGGVGGGGGGGEVDQLAKSYEELTKRLKEYKAETAGIANNAGEFGEMEKAARDFAKEAEAAGKNVAKMVGMPVEDWLKQFREADEAREKIEELRDVTEEIADGMGDAFGDFLERGFKDFGAFVDDIKGMFLNMLAEMVAAAAKQQIMISMGMTGTGGGAVGGAAGGLLGGVGKAIGGIGGGLLGGALSSLGGLASGGLGGMLGSIGTAIGGVGAASGVVGTLTAAATALGAIAAPIALAAAAVSFFRKKVTEVGRDVTLTATAFDASAETIRQVETKRFWGLSKKVKEEVDNSTSAFSGFFGAFNQIKGATNDVAASVGIAAGEFAGFSHTVRIAAKDLTPERLQEELGVMSEKYLAASYTLRVLNRAGETYAQTLERLTQTQAVVTAGLDLMNKGLGAFGSGLDRLTAMTNITDWAGGLEAAGRGFDTLFQQYMTAQQRAAEAYEQVSEVLNPIGLGVPQTRAEFLALAQALDLTTYWGQAAYGSLLKVAGTASAYYDYLEQAQAEATRAAQQAQAEATRVAEEAARAAQQAQAEAQRAAEEAFRTNMQRWDNLVAGFFTATEQAEYGLYKIGLALQGAGLSLPGTRAEFRKLAMSLDQTTASGFAAWVSLMSVADQAATYYAYLERAQDDATQAMQATLTELASTINEVEQERAQTVQELTRRYDALRAAEESMMRARENLAVSDLAPGTEISQLAELRRQFDTAIGDASAGDVDAANRAAALAQTVLQQALSVYGSSADYGLIFKQVNAALMQAQTGLGAQASTVQPALTSELFEDITRETTNQLLGALAQLDTRLADLYEQRERQENDISKKTARDSTGRAA